MDDELTKEETEEEETEETSDDESSVSPSPEIGEEDAVEQAVASSDENNESQDSPAESSQEPAAASDEKPSEDSSWSGSTWSNERPANYGGEHWRPSSHSISEGENSSKEIKVAVDWVELEGALENNSPELHSFLNTDTGDVIRIFEGGENAETRLKQSEASPDYLYVEPVSSREQYRWMEEFIEIVEEPTLKDKLNIAIDGKGAFRRFKDVLVGYPAEREKWFGKRSAKLREHMSNWLTSKHIVPTNTPPWEDDGEAEERRPRGEFESKSWHSSSPDLRTQAHELIDMVPSRELPTAVAFLEFLRSRRTYKRPRYN